MRTVSFGHWYYYYYLAVFLLLSNVRLFFPNNRNNIFIAAQASSHLDPTSTASSSSDNINIEVCSATDGSCDTEAGVSDTTAATTSDKDRIEASVIEEPRVGSINPTSLNLKLGEDLGLIQTIDESAQVEILASIEKARQYMQTVVYQDPKYARVKDTCRNDHESCAFWAWIGECEKNPSYMNISCAPMCQTCHQLDYYQRCPFELSDHLNIWKPGDLNQMFQRIVTHPEYIELYQPQVISRPNSYKNTTVMIPTQSNDTNVTTPPNLDDTNDGPWVVVLENFISAAEAQRLIDLGTEQGYERSGGVGKLKADGNFEASHIFNERTSTNAWCSGACYDDPVAQAVLERIQDLTKIPDRNTEYLQLLRYDVGQLYATHHDYIDDDVDRPSGSRVITLFLYLNDVEAGGGTNFPQLDITVYPKTGRALIWPSVLDHDPHKSDPRTFHQALPVEKGIKYGANAWMHQRDFKTPYENNCL